MRPPGPIVFFGTPDFAVPALEAMCSSGTAPALTVTQPARPRGRGRRLVEPPVARRARELGLAVELIESVKTEAFEGLLSTLHPWVGVVVAFGQIFPRSLLELPSAGCINLHASLLPKYRGAAPIQAAVAAGDAVTGVTTMQMDVGLDSGPVLLQSEVAVGEDETTPELAGRLAAVGAELLVETLEKLALGVLDAREQDASRATFAPKLSREDARVDWSLSATEIYNRWRAYQPWPGLLSSFRDEPIKLLGCRRSGQQQGPAEPGVILATGEGLEVSCGEGSTLALDRLQRPGRGALAAADFVNGERVDVGEKFV